MLSLFSSKILYYAVCHTTNNNKIKLLVFSVLSLFGVALNQYDLFPNYFAVRHSLELSLFLAMGNILGRKIDKISARNQVVLLAISLLVYVSIVAVYVTLGKNLPYVTWGFGTTIIEWPIHVILALSGTLIIIYASRFIKNEPLLEYVGRNSLFVYMTHGMSISLLLKYNTLYLESCSTQSSIMVLISLVINIIAIALIYSYILSKHPFNYLVGKF